MRKRRTRSHIIADLSANFIERLDYWLGEMMPVILILYDAQAEVAYWLYVQAYLQQQPDFSLTLLGETVTLYFDRSRTVQQDTIRQFAQFKAEVIRQWPGVIRHVF